MCWSLQRFNFEDAMQIPCQYCTLPYLPTANTQLLHSNLLRSETAGGGLRPLLDLLESKNGNLAAQCGDFFLVFSLLFSSICDVHQHADGLRPLLDLLEDKNGSLKRSHSCSIAPQTHSEP